MARVRDLGVACVGLVALAAAACGISPRIIPVPRATLHPPSAELLSYTDGQGLSLALVRTTEFCDSARVEMAREYDLRSRRLNSLKRTLLTIGSVASLGGTAYAGLVQEPRKEVVIPLGLVSGGALLSAIPALGTDERAEELRQKLANVRAKEVAVVNALAALELSLLEISLVSGRLTIADSSSDTWERLYSHRDSLYTRTAPVEDRLRLALATFAAECQ